MPNHNGLLTRTGTRLAAVVAVVVVTAGLMLAGGAVPARALPLPTVTSLSPTTGSASGGTSVTITGTSFTSTGMTVAFGGTTAAFTYVSATSITATSPGHVAGIFDVIVTTPDGPSATSGSTKFTYTPTVTSISPTSGSAAGGTVLTITGSGLTSGTVDVSGSACAVTSSGATQIVCQTTSHAAGLANVIVTVAAVLSPNTAADDFTYSTGPFVTSISPDNGPIAGGTPLTITGSGLSGGTVSVGGSVCSVTSTGATQIVCTTTSHAAGIANVIVTVASIQSTDTPADNFTYGAATITNVSPAIGPTVGGQTVTITGTNFHYGVNTVTFGVTPGTGIVVALGGGSLTVTTPASIAGTVGVTVTTPAAGSPTLASAYTFTSANLPVVSVLTPAFGPITGGNLVTITGTNLSGTSQVAFGSAIAFPATVSATQVTVVAPGSSTSGAQTVKVVVTTPAGPSSPFGAASDYTYTNGPTVTAVFPATGPASGFSFVTITGTGFTPTGMTVTFGGTTAIFTYVSATSISAVSPAHVAGLVDVIVTVAFVPSPNTLADDFTYTGTSAPTVTGVSPSTGPVGIAVTVTGTGFTGASAVTVGGVAAAYTVVSDSSITLTIPAGTPSGLVSIRITTPNGQNVDVAADNFTNTTTSGVTVTYTLYFRWSLISWNGIDNISASNALKGIETGTANPATNDVSGSVTAVWYFDGPSQTFKGYFVGFDNTPGANDFTTFRRGTSYWIAIQTSGTVTWTVLLGP